MTNARYSVSVDRVNVGGSLDNADSIDYRDFSSGMVYIPADQIFVPFVWYVSSKVDGVYVEAITQNVESGKAYSIPAELSGASFLKVLTFGGGTIGVTLKD